MKQFTVALLAILFSMTSLVGAKVIRLQFPAGQTTLTLKDITTGGPSESGGMDPITYRLNIRAGQVLTLHLTSEKKNAVFYVSDPKNGYEAFEGSINVTEWSSKFAKTGEFQIVVYPQDEVTDTKFTLDITLK